MEAQVLETEKRILGKEHPSTLISMRNLASTYRDQGRWREAEELAAQVLETAKRTLGEEHPSTLASIHNLALTYSFQGLRGEAQGLEKQITGEEKNTWPGTSLNVGQHRQPCIDIREPEAMEGGRGPEYASCGDVHEGSRPRASLNFD